MKVQSEIKLDFTDVLLRPKRSTLTSRSEVSLERKFTFLHSKQSWKGIPIIVSNMDTVGTLDMLKVCSKNHLLTCLHKFIDIELVIKSINEGLVDPEYMMVSTGIREKDWKYLNKIVTKFKSHKILVKFICIDVANGYMQIFADFCSKVRAKYPNITLIAGNVVTREVCEELIING